MATEPGVRIHRHPYRRRRWLGLLAGLAGLGLVAWLCWPVHAPAEAAAELAARTATAQAAAASGASISPFWSLAREAEDQVLAEQYRRAGVATLTPPPGSRIDAVEWEARRVDARWCADEAWRQGEGEGASADSSRSRAMRRLVDESARQLRLRADTQSQVVAEWLQFRYPADEAMKTRAQARLQELARQSRQPFAVYQALQAHCSGAAACTRVPASLWAEVEPDNRLAWLAALGEMPTASAQRAALMRAVQAPRSIEYGRHALQALLSLPLIQTPGLRKAAQQSLWVLFAVDTGLFHRSGLMRLCTAQEAAADLELKQVCSTLAQQLWKESEDLGALALAETLGRRADGATPDWIARGQERMGLQAGALSEGGKLYEAAAGQPLECSSRPDFVQYFADLATLGELQLLHARKLSAAQAEALSLTNKKSQP